MCGIVGMFTSTNFGQLISREKAMQQMLVADQFRGVDSTGLAIIKGANDINVFKRDVAGTDFIQLTRARGLLNNFTGVQAVIGHNRAATKGAVTSENAHPFRHGAITMVHNGSLNTWTALTTQHFQVDSEAICHALSTQTPAEVSKKLYGAYSLVWHDSRDNSINFLRNDERPMYFVGMNTTVQGASGWAFGSEHLMLQWILWRNSITKNKVLETTTHTLYKFDLANPAEYTTEEMPRVGKQLGYTAPYQGGNRWDSSRNGTTRHGNGQAATQSRLPAPESKPHENHQQMLWRHVVGKDKRWRFGKSGLYSIRELASMPWIGPPTQELPINMVSLKVSLLVVGTSLCVMVLLLIGGTSW